MVDEVTAQIRAHFDQLADGEWGRLSSSPRGRINFEVHRRLLSEFVSPGQRVLEIGAGPGRFTIAMAELGATVLVTDISAVQLALNERHVAEAGFDQAVETRQILDVVDTSEFGDGEFDVVVAFGGPLSYAFSQAEASLAGLLRVGNVVLASVMSSLGSWRAFLRQVAEEAAIVGQDATDRIIRTGDLRNELHTTGHVCRMFRRREVVEMFESCDAEILAACASNWASMADEEVVAGIEADPDHWSRFVDHELTACREPGALDGGTHLVFAGRRRDR